MSRGALTTTIIVVILLVAAGIYVFVSQSGNNPAAPPVATAPADNSGMNMNTNTGVQINTVPVPSMPGTHSVAIQNFAFVPASLTVKKGDTVVWTNMDSVPHTVTGDSGGPASPHINPGATYSFTFATAGTFAYHCSIHPSMHGTVVVTP